MYILSNENEILRKLAVHANNWQNYVLYIYTVYVYSASMVGTASIILAVPPLGSLNHSYHFNELGDCHNHTCETTDVAMLKLDLVMAIAICNSNSKIQTRFDMPDLPLHPH